VELSDALQPGRMAESRKPRYLAELADGWWDAAASANDRLTAEQFRRRAGQWYVQALPGLSGTAKLKVQRRLMEINR
jgi:hypothetical protein